MLRPRNTATRDAIQITGLWDFCLDPEDRGVQEKWFTYGLESPVRMSTGASFNDIFADRKIRDYSGAFWYRKRVKLPHFGPKQRLVLYFESVAHAAQVWVDDVPVCRHSGGYLPFEADITPAVESGGFAWITVRADNVLSFGTIPPGAVVQERSGPRQSYWHDFFNYAGIHRPVWLCVRPERCIEDITVVTDFDGADGLVRYDVRTASGGSVRAKLYDAGGALAAEGSSGELRIPQVHPWGGGGRISVPGGVCPFGWRCGAGRLPHAGGRPDGGGPGRTAFAQWKAGLSERLWHARGHCHSGQRP